MKNYNTVIFDLDGTLLDTLDDLSDGVNYIMRQYHFPEHSLEEVRSFVGNGVKKLIERSIPQGAANSDFEAAYQDFRAYYTEHCQIKTKAYQGIMELIGRLKDKDYKLAIVSNKNDSAVKELCKIYFNDLISVTIGEKEHIQKKPAPDTVLQALKELGSSKEEAVYVGDSEVDYETAVNTGMDCVLVSWGFRDRNMLEALRPDGLIDRPDQMEGYLEQGRYSGKKTQKLYDQDAYRVEFDAVVLSCKEMEKNGDSIWKVQLDQTLFFPEEGGQSADTGELQGIEVLDVQIRDDVITHTLAKPLQTGQTVHGKINWEHRFNNMQQHTGEHIFSGLVHRYFGYDNVGFHLSDQTVTMDFNGAMSSEQIMEIEQEVNKAIVKNIETVITFPSKAELKDMEYRSKIEIAGQVRIVTIPGYDSCACCAPHVRRTGEIGILKVIHTQNYKGGVRISILCGFRALADYQQKLAGMMNLSVLLSVKPELVEDTVVKLKKDLAEVKQELSSANQKLFLQKAEEIPETQLHVCLFELDADAGSMRTAVNALVTRHKGYCGVFTGNDEKGYRYIIGTGTGDARVIGNVLKDRCQARGGGSPEMIQGSLMGTMEQIQKIFSDLL